MKSTMIQKVAECQCIRMAGGSVFSGTYAPEEMSFQPRKVNNVTTIQPNIIDYSVSVDMESGEQMFTYDEVKSMLSKASTMEELGDAVSLIKEINITQEQKEKSEQWPIR